MNDKIDSKEILKRVQGAIRQVESYAGKYKKWDFWLLSLSIVLRTLATILASGVAFENYFLNLHLRCYFIIREQLKERGKKMGLR